MSKLRNKNITNVVKTLDQWNWYRKNPKSSKLDYFEMFDIKPITYLCYLCESFRNSAKQSFANPYVCEYKRYSCPLNTRTLHCKRVDAPYNVWSYMSGDDKVRVEQATRIIRACERWLRKYV